MKLKLLLILLVLVSASGLMEGKSKSDGLKPRWMTSSLPSPKSPGYIFISAQGSGSTLEEARSRALVNLTSKLEHERGLEISSSIKIEKTSSRDSAPVKNQSFTLEATERGKQINLTCRVVDEYWEQAHGLYMVTELYTVNDQTAQGQGSYSDWIRLTTSYGAAPMFYSLIPGVGQFVKGSNLKGGLFLGGTVVCAAAVVFCENQRADYAKKMKEKPQYFDFYRNKKSNWQTGRNVAIGVTAALYAYNLIDALVAPGRRRVIVDRQKMYYSAAPFLTEDAAGVSLALNF